jgi:hypothetical protein
MIRRIPEISPEQENFRLEEIAPRMTTIRRDPVEPVPVGTYVVRVFRVTGYDPDCDGSLMARVEAVDFDGQATGWTQDRLGITPDSWVALDSPQDLTEGMS